MSPSAAADVVESDLERRILTRLAQLRADRGWSLETLAARSGVSRATLSRLERAEVSPTAAVLGRLCTVYGWTLSRLMAEAETHAPSLVKKREQLAWTDPESGYRRRAVSPPAADLRGELVEVQIPASATVAFDTSPIPGLEHHLWMLDGALKIEVNGSVSRLRAGDALRYILNGSSRFVAGTGGARYLIALVRP